MHRKWLLKASNAYYLYQLLIPYKKIVLLLLFSRAFFGAAQETSSGILSGNLLDDKGNTLSQASIRLISINDSLNRFAISADKAGHFFLAHIPFGYYRLQVSHVGLQPLIIDSLHFRIDRSDFNMNDLVLKTGASVALAEVIVFAEKPLIQSKDGNITFNVAESALAAGSTASELLTNVPLVSKDADGKISVRGKEPKILIDDKPVELNLQQLQDLLESLPGSSIERIEVMTNPPPQYANEQGGVINIVTKKGKVGKSGRMSVSAGTRGEVNTNGNFNYRKKGFSFSINAGAVFNRITGNGQSLRENIYADSSNFFATRSQYLNKALRPNMRFNLDYDVNSFQSLNLVLQLNGNDYRNRSINEYTNINRFAEAYRISERSVRSQGDNLNSSLNISYLVKTRHAGEQLRIIGSINLSASNSDRDFYQQFFTGSRISTGQDSVQQQLTANRTDAYHFRVNYDRPFFQRKTFLSVGGYYNRSNSDIKVDASFLKKPEGEMWPSAVLSNDFRFHQDIVNLRASLKQLISAKFSITGGLAVEQTSIRFDLLKDQRVARNQYQTLLPFASINKTWEETVTLTLSWRRSIRRPGINELNPAIDFSDPYNTRFGNEKLEASTADNFDMVVGRTLSRYYFNIGMGYNVVKNIFSQVRTLIPDGKTQITWENISGRQEYEVSGWGGWTFNKKLRANISASYTYNRYSDFDQRVNRYRNGGSFNSNLNGTFSATDRLNFTGSFTFNRFASAQGYGRWNMGMNTGVQYKLLAKRMTITVNAIDPFVQQRNRNFTYGPNFNLQSFNTTRSRNFLLTVGYNLTRPPKSLIPAGLIKAKS